MVYKDSIRKLTLEEARFFMNMAECEQLTLRYNHLLLYKTKCLDNKNKPIVRSFFWNDKRCWINYFPPEFAKPVKKVFGCSAEANFLLMKYMFDGQETPEFCRLTKDLNNCIVRSMYNYEPRFRYVLDSQVFTDIAKKATTQKWLGIILNELRNSHI